MSFKWHWNVCGGFSFVFITLFFGDCEVLSFTHFVFSSSWARLHSAFTLPSQPPLWSATLAIVSTAISNIFYGAEHLFSLLTQSFFIWFKWHGFLMLASCRRVFFCVHVSKWNCHTHNKRAEWLKMCIFNRTKWVVILFLFYRFSQISHRSRNKICNMHHRHPASIRMA